MSKTKHRKADPSDRSKWTEDQHALWLIGLCTCMADKRHMWNEDQRDEAMELVRQLAPKVLLACIRLCTFASKDACEFIKEELGPEAAWELGKLLIVAGNKDRKIKVNPELVGRAVSGIN